MDLGDSGEEKKRDIVRFIVRHMILIGILIFLLVLVLAVLQIDHNLNEKLNARIAAMRARGEPVSVEDLNAKVVRLSDAENGLTEIRALAAQINNEKAPLEIQKDLDSAITYDLPTGRRWNMAQREAVAQYMHQSKEQYARIHEILQSQKVAMQITWSSPVVSMPPPDYGGIRKLAFELYISILAAAQENNSARVVEAILDLAKIQHFGNDNDGIIATFTERAIHTLLQQGIERSINLVVLDPNTLRQIQGQLHDVEHYPDLRQAIMADRLIVLDFWNMRTNAPISAKVNWPIISQLNMTKFLDWYDEMLTSTSVRNGTSIKRIMNLEVEINAPSQFYDGARQFTPNLRTAVERWVTELGQNRAMQVCIASERYRLENGHWPTDINALVPNYLQDIPLDPCDGRAIRYAIIPEVIMSWTIGEDLKDDRGDIRRFPPRQDYTESKDWGWVILNPELRGRPAPVTTTQKGN